MKCRNTNNETTIEAMRTYTNVFASIDDLDINFINENLDEMNIDNRAITYECLECNAQSTSIKWAREHVKPKI
ncbi:hypothetical protein LCGC14_0196010 [marine sediment metagenome]|uniref:Uncharacterized protein n=1 Tax=marine sediment metagenome TaxID=412755 RepID=A0A0F9XNK7_9ZZZZ